MELCLYKGFKITVSVHEELSNFFSVTFGVHQGSALRPLFLIMVVNVPTEYVRDGSLMELLSTDDLVLCEGSLNEVMGKYGRWKNGVEGKGLRVNVDKTKDMQ